jgi:DNA-binding response OmpR family regulator
LIILDLNLPKLDGLEVCRRIRIVDNTPIIMLSVRSGDEVIVKGLELGADDYVVKPFSPSQLVARIRAVLRRNRPLVGNSPLTVGEWTLDQDHREVRFPNATPLRLTQMEVRLLAMLMLHVGQVLTTDQLIAQVWGADGADRTMLKQLVYRLRAKLETVTSQSYIETVPGVGYTLIQPESKRNTGAAQKPHR